MEIRVIEEKVNPLLLRKEYIVEIAHPRESSPKRNEVRKEFSKTASIPVERVVVEYMEALYGVPASRGVIHAYDKPEVLKTTVRRHIQVRNGLASQDGAVGQKPAEKKESAPAETKGA